MTEQPPSPADEQPVLPNIDTRVTQPARLYNYLAGGDGNFAVDREVAEKIAASLPAGFDTVRAAVRSLAHFTERAVRYLVTHAGVRQLLYVGTPVPSGREVHEIAQQAAPDTRVVYVGNDPVVLAHAHRLRRGTPDGATAYIHGTLRQPAELWARARETLDPGRPVAVLAPVTLCLVPDEADPFGLVAALLGPTQPGSYLAIAHVTSDIPIPGLDEATARLAEALDQPYVVRSKAEIARFVDGLELVEPGLVQVDAWRPDPAAAAPGAPLPIYAAVARKP